jgi:hypothetical protein
LGESWLFDDWRKTAGEGAGREMPKKALKRALLPIL